MSAVLADCHASQINRTPIKPSHMKMYFFSVLYPSMIPTSSYVDRLNPSIGLVPVLAVPVPVVEAPPIEQEGRDWQSQDYYEHDDCN